jgi:hypothetical protein
VRAPLVFAELHLSLSDVKLVGRHRGGLLGQERMEVGQEERVPPVEERVPV